MHQKLLIVVGPTASGKSALGVRLARRFQGEIISADSRQVYRGLNIGTGKVTKREMEGITHHLLDVASPKKILTAHDFDLHATSAIAKIVCRGNLPILVGGTGFYVDALVGRIALPFATPNPALRSRLGKKSATQLYTMLKKKDPKRARALSSLSERNNKVRLIRALEVATSQKSTSTRPLARAYDALWIGIVPPLPQLEKKIRLRLVTRLRKGMIAEAQHLHRVGLSYKRMGQLGLEYRSLSRYLQKKIERHEMIAELERDIRRYAKKQLTYWKRNKDIKWFKPTEGAKIETVVQKWLKRRRPRPRVF